MSKTHLYLGKSGEEIAVALLARNGYRILKRNYKSRFGEIDIIASCQDTFCFVEVKTRKDTRFGLPQESISQAKKKHIIRAALAFLKENNLLEKKIRFDVVAVISSGTASQADLIKNAFTAEDFSG